MTKKSEIESFWDFVGRFEDYIGSGIAKEHEPFVFALKITSVRESQKNTSRLFLQKSITISDEHPFQERLLTTFLNTRNSPTGKKISNGSAAVKI